MKRSLDLDGLHDALPLTCRANSCSGQFEARHISKRVRQSGEMAGGIGLLESPGSAHVQSAFRQVHRENMLDEGILSSVLGSCGPERPSCPAPHTERLGPPLGSPAELESDRIRSTRENPFPVRPPLLAELDAIVAGLSPSRRKPGSAMCDSAQVSESDELRIESPTPPTPGTLAASLHDRLYTHEELRAVVSKALSIQGSSLRAEYNGVLHAKLAEQFQSFTKFNQDYISRQIKGNPFSYVS